MRLIVYSGLFLAFCAAVTMERALGEEIYVVPDAYIVTRRADLQLSTASQQKPYSVTKHRESFDLVRYHGFKRIKSQAGGSTREVLDPIKVLADCAEIERDPSVRSCEPDVWETLSVVPNDPSFALQWHLDSPVPSADVGLAAAWQKGTGSKDVVIGVVDTGIASEHPDLLTNQWVNPNDPVDGRDNDGNGFIDDVHGVNTAKETSNPNDLHGHGSHVSGIIGARGDNAIGVSGVMWRVSLAVAAASASASGSILRSDLIEAIDYLYGLKVRGNNIRAVNGSFGGDVYSSAMYAAISRLNDVDVLFVASAGNWGKNVTISPHYPCTYDLANVICVAATGPTQKIAFYSNYGSSVDIAAPGGDSVEAQTVGMIYSTYSPLAIGGGNYGYLQGTSMATPVVTGALGLLASQRPYLSGAQLKSILLSSADVVTSLQSSVDRGRFLNVAAMVNASDPLDRCPNDPSKSEPGRCGCGVVESYLDRDSDGVLDCLDGCPTDRARTSPGSCGCGALDVDADGQPDCLDGCPSDRGKTSPGVCGCGVSDVDANSNGAPDCKDPMLAGILPERPKLKLSKGKVVVAMKGKPGVGYFLRVVTKIGKSKPKISYYSTTGTAYVIKGLKPKTDVAVSYAYFLDGKPVIASTYSAEAKIKTK